MAHDIGLERHAPCAELFQQRREVLVDRAGRAPDLPAGGLRLRLLEVAEVGEDHLPVGRDEERAAVAGNLLLALAELEAGDVPDVGRPADDQHVGRDVGQPPADGGEPRSADVGRGRERRGHAGGHSAFAMSMFAWWPAASTAKRCSPVRSPSGQAATK